MSTDVRCCSWPFYWIFSFDPSKSSGVTALPAPMVVTPLHYFLLQLSYFSSLVFITWSCSFILALLSGIWRVLPSPCGMQVQQDRPSQIPTGISRSWSITKDKCKLLKYCRINSYFQLLDTHVKTSINIAKDVVVLLLLRIKWRHDCQLWLLMDEINMVWLITNWLTPDMFLASDF